MGFVNQKTHKYQKDYKVLKELGKGAYVLKITNFKNIFLIKRVLSLE